MIKSFQIRMLLIFKFVMNPLSAQHYLWKNVISPNAETVESILLPTGYTRVMVDPDSFAGWLRGLPLKPTDTPVLLFDGRKKYNQNIHFRVIDIDVGDKDLQQCADAVMRLRAEYLYSVDQKDKIRFNFVSGHIVKYSDWINGRQPIIYGDQLQYVRWSNREPTRDTYDEFREKYLEKIFMFAGTQSLQHELQSVSDPISIEIGDVFIQGPGHTVIVLDVAENQNHDRIFIVAQSYMPAQDIHILVNPLNARFSPWYYAIDDGSGSLQTPEWDFQWSELKRF